MKVRELITEAFYLSDKTSEDFETVIGSNAARGLTLLNDILSEKNSDGKDIPYYDRLLVNAVIGQEKYFVPNLVSLETLTVTIAPQYVRFSMAFTDRDAYFGTSRINNIESIPQIYYSERTIDPDTGIPGTYFWCYWLPSQTDFIFEVTGQFGLQKVTLDTVISNSLEGYYLSYLKYELANRICDWYSLIFDPQKANTLTELRKKVQNLNPLDMTCTIANPFPGFTVWNWGDVNIGHGYRPIGSRR